MKSLVTDEVVKYRWALWLWRPSKCATINLNAQA